jgi:hypothetical protein
VCVGASHATHGRRLPGGACGRRRGSAQVINTEVHPPITSSASRCRVVCCARSVRARMHAACHVCRGVRHATCQSCLAVHVAEREEVRRLLAALYCVYAQVAAHHLPESPVCSAGPFRYPRAVRDGRAAGQCRRSCG